MPDQSIIRLNYEWVDLSSILIIMIMQVKILIVLLLISLSLTHKHYKCVFEQLNKDLREESKKAKPDVSSVEPSASGRRLLSITRSPMRITLDSSSFNQMKPGLNGATTTTADNLAFILKTMQVASFFYMNRLQVYPLTTINAPILCQDYDTPPNDQTYGISASDLHLYVTYITDKGASYGANGKSCKYYGDGTTPLPDDTLQIGRPTIGRIVFNTYSLVDTANGLTNRLFQSVVSTALHETLHILGMDSTLYSSWLDSDPTSPTFNNAYASTTTSASSLIASQRLSTTMFLTTPNVKAWTRTFFGCATAPGMLLENEDSAQGVGSGGGSHWERVAMYDEIMTGTALGAVKYFSGLTLSALRDMGWYTVDATFNETSNFGYQKGCNFLYKACYGTSFQEFCDAAALASISLCSSTFYSKAICSSGAGLMADGCGLYGPYFNCVDPDSQNDGYQSYTSQVYSTNSFCVSSTLGTVALPSTVQSRCYPYVCNPANITFTIGANKITCLSTENSATQKTISVFTGYLACPDFNQFCASSRKTCPNWCSQNGYCMGGICNCITGYYGDDCSKTTCTSGLFFNPLSGTCVGMCASGYYQNSYNTACVKCANSCQQCYGEPTTCTGCLSTANNPQYYYAPNQTCYSVCPDGTYANGFNCLACDNAGAYCKTCSVTATNCTFCNSGRFLSQPLFGTCLISCPSTGTYSVTDLVNFGCVSTCANNLVLVNVGNNNNTCQFCPNSTYKYTANSSCISSCPNFYYANNLKWLCSPCDSSCLTCSGGLAENCISCSPSATLRYLLLNMCWSVCPGGYYPNNAASVCQICPIELNCGNCTFVNTTMTVYCTSCAYGFFYQYSTQTCLTGCSTTQYANTANNTCLSCDSNCKTCNGPTSSQCASCNGPLLFKGNVTGGYCVSACPAVGYYKDGVVSCVACDPSCVTCSGGGTSRCTSCFNNTYLSSGYCRMVCPPAKFPSDATNKCLACDGSCTFCFGSTIDNCTACITGMVLWNFTCTTSCPKGYTVNQWNVCFEKKMQVLLSFAVLALIAIFL